MNLDVRNCCSTEAVVRKNSFNMSVASAHQISVIVPRDVGEGSIQDGLTSVSQVQSLKVAAATCEDQVATQLVPLDDHQQAVCHDQGAHVTDHPGVSARTRIHRPFMSGSVWFPKEHDSPPSAIGQGLCRHLQAAPNSELQEKQEPASVVCELQKSAIVPVEVQGRIR